MVIRKTSEFKDFRKDFCWDSTNGRKGVFERLEFCEVGFVAAEEMREWSVDRSTGVYFLL
jgi:hypothetical protein